jgi:cytosine/adenosine deaminase-related metal-dependent hydrolase
MIEPLEEARAIELDERLATGVRGGHSGSSLLAAATSSGYASLGWAEGGNLAEGALADFVAVRLAGVRLGGVPRADLIDAVVFAGAAGDVSDVVVAGELIVRDGAHRSLDVGNELASAVAAVTQ